MENEKNYQDFLTRNSDDGILDMINPTPESKNMPELKSSEKLENGVVRQFLRYEPFYGDFLVNTETEVEKDEAKARIDTDYLSLLALNSQDENRSNEERQKWADYFTNQSVKIYGAPDAKIVREIEAEKGEDFLEKYAPILGEVREYLEKKYADVFAKLDVDESEKKFDIEEISARFSAGLEALKLREKGFENWSVEVKKDSSILSTSGEDKKIFIGENRAEMTGAELKGLFAHEVLRHAVSAVNMEKIGIDTSLANYTSTEEGFANIYQIALGGKDPKVSMTRYADIGWALGMVDGKKHTRSEFLERKKMKNISEKSARNTAARIFRGTPGSDEVSGVFTKDIAYFDGLVSGLEYISRKEKEGENLAEILTFAESAKFNVNDEKQVKFVREKIVETVLNGFLGIKRALPAPKNIRENDPENAEKKV